MDVALTRSKEAIGDHMEMVMAKWRFAVSPKGWLVTFLGN
jgi:hypothetical protein